MHEIPGQPGVNTFTNNGAKHRYLQGSFIHSFILSFTFFFIHPFAYMFTDLLYHLQELISFGNESHSHTCASVHMLKPRTSLSFIKLIYRPYIRLTRKYSIIHKNPAHALTNSFSLLSFSPILFISLAFNQSLNRCTCAKAK